MDDAVAERLMIWFLGFLAGVTLGSITFGGGGGNGDWPAGVTPPVIPDYVPDSLQR